MKDQGFYDNPDAALNLPKRLSYRSGDLQRLQERQSADKEQYLREIGASNEAELQRVVPRNVGAHDEIGERMQKYVDAGYSTLEAIAAAESEIDDKERGPSDDYLGASIEDLMKPPVTPDKHSSRSRSKKVSRGGSDTLQREVLRTYGRVA